MVGAIAATSGALVLSALALISASIANMAVGEIASNLGLKQTKKMLAKTEYLNIDEPETSYSGLSASEAVSEYLDAGGSLSKVGSAITSAKQYFTLGVANVLGGYSAVALGSVSLPVAFASVVPQLGYSITNWELFTTTAAYLEAVNRVREIVWEGTEAVPCAIDGDGRMYLPIPVFEALNGALAESGIERPVEYNYYNDAGSEAATGINGRLDTPLYSLDYGGGSVAMAQHVPLNPRYTSYFPSDGWFSSPDPPSGPTKLTIVSSYQQATDLSFYLGYIFTTEVSQAGKSGWRSYTQDGRTVWYAYAVTSMVKAWYESGYYSFPSVVNSATRDIMDVLIHPEIAPSSGFGRIMWLLFFGEGTAIPYPVGGLGAYPAPPVYGTDGEKVITVASNLPVTAEDGDYGEVPLPKTREIDFPIFIIIIEEPGKTPEVEPPPDDDQPNKIVPYIPVEVPEIQYPETETPPDEDERKTGLPDPDKRPTPVPILSPTGDPSSPTDPRPQPESPPDTPSSSGESETPPIFDIVPPVEYSFIPPAGQSGMIHVYNPTAAQFWSFAGWLWQTFAQTGTLQPTIWSNPFDGVISAHEIYCTPISEGTDNIRCGYLSCPTTAGLVRQRYVTINCGSIIVQEKFGNYLDYSPYTKCHLFLPFIGIVELNSDFIVGHGVNVQYNIDTYTGTCVAFVTVAKEDYENTVYEFEGDCSSELPLSGGSMAAVTAARRSANAQFYSGVATTIMGGIGALLGSVGGVGTAVNGAVQALTAGANNSAKTDVSHSGGFTGCAGAMSAKKPYLMVTRPIAKNVSGYPDMYGYASHEEVPLGGCTGFIKCRSVHVASATATEDEKNMIEQLLLTGVFM